MYTVYKHTCQNGKVYDALREVNGKSVGNISSCCSGKKKNAYGYLWKLERGQ